MNAGEERPLALAAAEAGSGEWRAAAVAQRAATPDDGEFYGLAGELVATLRAVDELVQVLARQVAGYPRGRRLFDDAGVDPLARLATARAYLAGLSEYVTAAERAANGFWSAIGHIGTHPDDPDGMSVDIQDGAR
ncbi:MAG: hypothetical protein ACRDRK_03415 [Pseudonocardia sp.]